jgi:2'-5' RNA ligase
MPAGDAEERFRAFYALSLPGQLSLAAEALRAELSLRSPALSWVRPASYHLTLKFLGQVRASDEQGLARGLDEAAAERLSISASVGGLEAFPSARKARVLVLAVAPSVELAGLAARLDELSQRFGVPPETRPFRPHVTLARARGGADLRPLIESAGFSSQPARFAELGLYRSRAGGHYDRLHILRLAAARGEP